MSGFHVPYQAEILSGEEEVVNFLHALRRPHIAVLWLSQVLSAVGDQLYAIAVIWLAVQVAGSGAGFVAAAQSLSALAFGLLGGVYADRWNRRTTMIAVDTLRALAVATLPVLAAFHLLQLWHLAVVAVLIGGLGALFDPALQASLPALTSGTTILQATNGLMDTTRRLARAVAPSLVGLLVVLMPMSQFFTLDAVSFLVSAGAVLSLGSRYAWQPEAQAKRTCGVRGVAQEMWSAVRLVHGYRPLLWAFAGLLVIATAWALAFTVGAAFVAERVLHAGAGTFGLIVGAYGIGNILSNLVIGSITIRRRIATIFSAKIILGLGFMVVALSRSLPLTLFGAAFAAVAGPMGDIMLLTLIQTGLPSNQIGKVYGLMMTLGDGGMALGLLLAVPLYAHFPVPVVIAGAALAMIVTGIIGLLRFGFTEPADSFNVSTPVSGPAVQAK